jgi:F-type H+-transporting ATPase subunit b
MPRLAILGSLLLSVAVLAGAADRRALADDEPATTAAAVARESGLGHGEEKPNILSADVVLGISTLVVFLLLLFVLKKFAWGPLQIALHEREEHLEHTLEATEHARQEAERLLAEHRAQMAQVADQVRGLIDKAHRDAEAASTDIIRKAQGEAEAARQRAEREIGNARDQAIVEIWNKAADLAVSVAGKVLTRELTDADHRRLIEVATHELPASPSATNGHGGHS